MLLTVQKTVVLTKPADDGNGDDSAGERRRCDVLHIGEERVVFNAKCGKLVHNEDGERHSARLGRPRLARRLKMAILLVESEQFYFKRWSLLSDDGAKEAPSNGKRDRS